MREALTATSGEEGGVEADDALEGGCDGDSAAASTAGREAVLVTIKSGHGSAGDLQFRPYGGGSNLSSSGSRVLDFFVFFSRIGSGSSDLGSELF